ncbi:DoxX family protein [Achromobacter marplatensis]|uniref:Membrane protein YphA (DoxX/SURF4 family) n=1 Tax=Achromobacter marplatensis TaxID=470868 RepID=A0ABX9GHQ1_9BURK|nr:DoxX family protein [Achromobacter marplatensis]OWT72655.1 DoxX family protein [Achromobacter marplatensis]RBP24092.1 putative membrane protein YphA (DoxX/SURF4 family) [Achromobacter marplatensis]CAB3628452.1 hypothetical protein LMG26219_00706 [Achromobacter marplatensis]
MTMPAVFTSPAVRWLALLALCGAYVQGGLVKLMDFNGAQAEMAHFGLHPAHLAAAAVILLELGASALVLTGRLRWLGALALAGFTAAAALMANRYWEAPADARFMTMNAFYEHIGLAGAWVLVAWHDLTERTHGRR